MSYSSQQLRGWYIPVRQGDKKGPSSRRAVLAWAARSPVLSLETHADWMAIYDSYEYVYISYLSDGQLVFFSYVYILEGYLIRLSLKTISKATLRDAIQ